MKNIMDKVKGERKVRYQDLVLLAGAGGLIMDLKEGRIDNRWILLCLGCGLLSHTIRDGPAGLFSGFAGILTPFLLLFWLNFFQMLGAGDIKLFCALGAFLGPGKILELLGLAFIFGAIYGLFYLFLTGSFCHRFRYFIRYFRQTILTGTFSPYTRLDVTSPGNFHFSWTILAGAWMLQLR